VRRKLDQAYYELEDLQGKLVGTFHAKDIKQKQKKKNLYNLKALFLPQNVILVGGL